MHAPAGASPAALVGGSARRIGGCGCRGLDRDPAVFEHVAAALDRRHELALVVAGIGQLGIEDELVLVVDAALHVVADQRPAVLAQAPRIGVGARELGLAAVLQRLDGVALLGKAGLECFELLGADRRGLGAVRLAGVVALELGMVGVDLVLEREQLALELLERS
jgi:hypothetical protein